MSSIEVVLVDADVLPYQEGALKEKHPFLSHIQVPLAVNMLERRLETFFSDVLRKTGASRYEVVLSGNSNWRYKVAKQAPYKGNRIGLTKPDNWQIVRDLIIRDYSPFITSSWECDDELAIRQKRYTEQGIVSCIASIDKDLRTVPGWNFDWRKDREPKYITEIEALRWYYTQILTGDPADNILGAGYIHKLIGKKGDKKGIGYFKKRGIRGAEALLRDCTTEKEMYDIVRQQYVKMFSEQEADELMLESARLLYMGSTGLHDLYNFPDFTEAP